MSAISAARPKQTIELVTDVENGDGKTVRYRILLADQGDILAEIDAPVTAGVARATWAVDVGDRSLPTDVRFIASIDDGPHIESERIRIDPPGMLGLAAWLIDPQPSSNTPGELEITDREPSSDLGFVSSQPFTVGDSVILSVDVGDDVGDPLTGEFSLVYLLQKEETENGGDYRTVKEFNRPVSASQPVDRVLARWTVDTLGLPPPHRFRFLVRWERRPQEQGQTPGDVPGVESA